jgi:hypothetical protein
MSRKEYRVGPLGRQVTIIGVGWVSDSLFNNLRFSLVEYSQIGEPPVPVLSKLKQTIRKRLASSGVFPNPIVTAEPTIFMKETT